MWVGDETDWVLGLEMGADDYLAKPLSACVLVQQKTEFCPVAFSGLRRHLGDDVRKAEVIKTMRGCGYMPAARVTAVRWLGSAIRLLPKSLFGRLTLALLYQAPLIDQIRAKLPDAPK